MSLKFSAALAVAMALGATLAGPAWADTVTLSGTLDAPDTGSTYTLTGQNAFTQDHNGSGTSGDQLLGQGTGVLYQQFTELFPPASLSDYLTFSYFGLIETRDGDDNLLDTSLVMAFKSGQGVGSLIGDYFSGYDEDTLVSQFGSLFDSEEFLELLDLVPQNTNTRGDISWSGALTRSGETLDLVAFVGGTGGHEGVKVGELSVDAFRAAVVPLPGAVWMGLALLGGLGGVGWARRRRGALRAV